MQGAVTRFLLLITFVHPFSAAAAQQFAAGPAAGVAIQLPGGRFLILNRDSIGVVVAGLVAGDTAAGSVIDLQQGDRLIRFQGITIAGLSQLDSIYRAVPSGAVITMDLQRAAARHSIRFPRQADADRKAMVVRSPAAAGAGAWVTGGGAGGGGDEVVIAGAHIRDNDQGLPQVIWLSSHPAMGAVPLQAGDVITSINTQPIAALAGLQLGYDRLAAGDSVKLTVTRGGRTMSVTFLKPAP